MDTITHALAGALLARAATPRQLANTGPATGQRVLAGGLAAAFPDIDIVTSLASPIAYLTLHRGVTHSIVLLPLWTVLLALAMGVVTRQMPHWRPYAPVCALGLGSHIGGDWITPFGTMVFAPLSDARYALGTTFIIDLIFSGIIVAGLLVCLLWRGSRLPAIISLCTLAGYIGMQAWLRAQAAELGISFAAAQGVSGARVFVLPRPPLPVNWTIVLQAGERYHFAHINLWRRSLPQPAPPDAGLIARMHAGFMPATAASWSSRSRFGDAQREQALARAAWSAEGLRFYRWFAELPALHRIEGDAPCVWFEDLRFRIPGRRSLPFRFGACGAADGSWQPYKLSEGGTAIPVR
jgi:inner membrane protein